jgi:hypothetical protein
MEGLQDIIFNVKKGVFPDKVIRMKLSSNYSAFFYPDPPAKEG